jgi:cytochrome c biogenesis protein CcmG/thiol:disulfide interchange protein DsbE
MNAKQRATNEFCRLARCLGACVLITASLVASAQPARVHSLVGKQAPAFTRLDLSGQTINLRSLRGKVVLLNFWATWCAPCQQEMPVFSAWRREYGSQGLAVIGISMDDDADSARNLVNKLGLTYPVAMGDAKLGERYGGVLGLPMTFLIGRNGKVLAQFQGETDLKTMEAKLKSALNLE